MCDNQSCAVHVRKDDRRDVTKEFGSGVAITYLDDICVVTADNPAFASPLTALMALLGDDDTDLPGMFFTFAVRVGERAVGDLTEDEVQANLLHSKDFLKVTDDFDIDAPDAVDKMNEMFHNHHDEVVLGVQSGLIA